MTDIMVDVETMGLNPHTSGLIQLAAIKFNYETGEVGEHFDRCPLPLPFRGWNDGTREFWLGKNRKVYEQIVARAEPARPVFEAFVDWVLTDQPEEMGYRFWSKPLSFDWPFVADHLEQLGLRMPFHYRYARDLNSFIAGLKGDPIDPVVEADILFKGDEHNALHDTAFQIDMLLHTKARYIPTEIMP
jgi:hypothetical protein